MDNVAAFLSAIAHGEGVDQAPDPFRVCFGFKHTIVSFDDHPAITGEWTGEPLDFLGPAYHGLVSTAAGRYQITKHTWANLKAKLKLQTFEPSCQDEAAVQLLKECGAFAMIQSGEFESAIAAASKIWASLPGSVAGQPIKPMADLMDVYEAEGGRYA